MAGMHFKTSEPGLKSEHLMENSNNMRKNSAISLKFQQKTKNQVFNKTWDLYVYTVCMIFLGFNYALVAYLYAPALIDFKYMFHTSLNEVSFANFFRMFGYLLGSLVGFFYSRLNRQIVIALMVCVLGCFAGALPFCTHLWQVYLCTTISMLGAGAFDCGAGVWIVEMWGVNSAAVLQLSKATNGLGVIVAPLLEEPFLVGELSIHNLTQFHHNSTAISLANEELNYSIDRRSRLQIPFMIAGGLTLPIPLILIVMFIIKRYRPSNAEKSQVISESKPELSPKVKYSLISLIALSLTTFGGMEMIHLSYSSTYYQELPIHLSAQKAAEIMSVVSATLTLGKLFSALVSVKLKPETMIIYSFVILAISMAILYFGCNTELIIWIGNGIIGFGFSAVWSAYFSLADNHMGLTNNISSIFLAVSTICPMISPFICGPYIEKNPQIFLITELVYFILTIILFVIIMLILRKSSRSLKKSSVYSLNSVIDCK